MATAAVGAVVCLCRFQRQERTTERSLDIVALIWALVPPVGLTVISLAEPVMVPRYVIAAVPGFALLVATGLDAIDSRIARGTAAIGVISLLIAGQFSWHVQPHDDFRSVATHIEAHSEPGDGLFLPNPFVRPQLDYLWLDGRGAPEGLIPMTPLDPIGSLPRFYKVPDVSTAELWNLLLESPVQRIWVLDQQAHLLTEQAPTYLARPDFAKEFSVAERTTYDGELTLYLLTRNEA